MVFEKKEDCSSLLSSVKRCRYRIKKGTLSVPCDLGGIRTLDPLIKSQLLYQLSYEVLSMMVARRVSFSLATLQRYNFS